MKIEIECSCGKTIEPDFNDVVIDSEDYNSQDVVCPECGAKCRVHIHATFDD